MLLSTGSYGPLARSTSLLTCRFPHASPPQPPDTPGPRYVGFLASRHVDDCHPRSQCHPVFPRHTPTRRSSVLYLPDNSPHPWTAPASRRSLRPEATTSFTPSGPANPPHARQALTIRCPPHSPRHGRAQPTTGHGALTVPRARAGAALPVPVPTREVGRGRNGPVTGPSAGRPYGSAREGPGRRR